MLGYRWHRVARIGSIAGARASSRASLVDPQGSGNPMFRIFSSFVVCSALAFAQEEIAPEVVQGPVLPEANSDAARALVAKALDKTGAYARGNFTTTEGQDSAMFRNAGLPVGAQETEVSGGWDRTLIWAESDGSDYVTANGRMLAKVDGEWRLRRGKLAGGVDAPFTLDPDYLVAALKQLPKASSNIVHVEAGKLRGKAMVLLTIKLDNDIALEFSDCGAVPDVGGGLGGIMMLGGMGMAPPRPELETYVVFYVDSESGDLARLSVKTYSTSEMMGQIQIQGGGGFGGDAEEEDDEDDDQGGPVKWKRGLPRLKPAKDQSVMTFRADFKKLGLAEAPKLDERSKALLRMR